MVRTYQTHASVLGPNSANYLGFEVSGSHNVM